jgi:methylmalonyl-CoA/ethylmalonyl-CoA epimerase
LINKVEHIGIAVANAEQSNILFEKLLGHSNYKVEKVASEGVATYFYNLNGTKIELLEATDDNSPISKFIEKRKQGIHHLAFHVDDINSELDRLVALGFEKIGEVKKGADNKLICFLHPKTTNGVLVELCQEIDQ